MSFIKEPLAIAGARFFKRPDTQLDARNLSLGCAIRWMLTR